MSEPIKEDDLVVVVKTPPCGCTHSIGVVFRVSALSHGNCRCRNCREEFYGDYDCARGYGTYSFMVSRLKRIPPLDEKELREEVMEITA